MRINKAIYTVGLSAFMLMTYAANVTSAEAASLTGTLTYRQHKALPFDAVISIRLVDVSPLQDASGDIIARQNIPNSGQLPMRFELRYNPARINSQHTYAIQAFITAQGKLLFTNTSAYPVLTRGNPSKVDIVVNPAK